MASTILVCPECSKSSRTTRVLAPKQKVRCGDCGQISQVFIHANGAVELRPYIERSTSVEIPSIGLPPRTDGKERKTVKTKQIERPRGGYAPFEKARSYLGTVVLVGMLGIGGFTAYWYGSQINTLQNATGRGAGKGDIWRQADQARHKEYMDRQKKALERIKAKTQKDKGT